MIERYYSQINILEYQEGSFGEPAKYTVKGTFKGLIQTPSNSQTFNNSKDTSNVSGVLFCSVNEKFEPKTIIEQDGNKFIISGQGTQTNGVSGITPARGQHAEYNLVWLQEGI